LVGGLEYAHRNHFLTAELDAIRILFPRRKHIHDAASPSVFPMGIHEILFEITIFSQFLNQVVSAGGISWFQLAKESSQILRSGNGFEKSRKIGYEEGGRRIEESVQVSHADRNRLECRLNFLVGTIKQRRKDSRLNPAIKLGKKESTFIAKAG
jgi:hypothetical protein